jgi:REP element-mobilizing transposase RayT
MGDGKTTAPSGPLVAGFHARNALPHLKREGASYFVTFRLAGTLPAELITRLKTERQAILAHALAAKRPLTWPEQEELFRWYARRVDAHLDAGHGDCFLAQPQIAGLVAGALRHFHEDRHELGAWVIMPNHVHVLVRPRPGWTLSAVLHSWKSYTATQANRLLGRAGRPFWQKESYDHLVRDDQDHARCHRYIEDNPVTARLCDRPEAWRWSSAHRG